MDFLDVLLDIGFDYGAQGGPDDFGVTIAMASGGRELRVQTRERPLRQWQLGNRTVDRAYLNKIQNYWHTFRGPLIGFLHKDLNDFLAEDEPLVIDGTATAQLIKTYGGGLGNDYVRQILKPAAGATFTKNGAPLSVASVDIATGIVTFNMPYPTADDEVTWSGEFYVPARFASDRLSAQFQAFREEDKQAIYSLGSLVVQELVL
ncbi:MAG TPA: DUF2460 domain-containing protein [Nevskiaceae bacterium]|nr:DUF2460 domain-containing protein [Nevskiaceae bacterium]